MKKDNILIALEKLDIGGIETFVLNQTKALIKKGKKVFLLAKKGRYSKIFESLGAKIYEYEYLDCIYYILGYLIDNHFYLLNLSFLLFYIHFE